MPRSRPQRVAVPQAFEASLGFELDRFQRQALDALDAGGSVVVAAPTGSGKTVVAEYAVARALDDGAQGVLHHARSRRCPTRSTATWSAATAPSAVGLLTGDNAINGDAPVVVMTTEVLRNMIYAASPALDGPALRDPRRGPLPAERLPGPGVGGGHHPQPRPRSTWSACRPRCPTPRSWPTGSAPSGARPTAVIEERRPVDLHDLYLLGDRASERLLLLPDPGRRPAQPGGERPRLARRCATPGMRGRPRGRLFTPRRVEVVELLDERRHAPGDLLHLQPGRVRRRRGPVRAGGQAADHRRGAPPDPGHRRGARRRPVRRGPAGARTTAAG